jgi:GTP cyclohydrolase I
MKVRKISWAEVFDRIRDLGIDHPDNTVYGVPDGGMIVASFLTNARRTHDPSKANVIIDDVLDSGYTLRHYEKTYDVPCLAIVDKKTEHITDWVEMPWASDHPSKPETIEKNITRMLQYIGEDVSRAGLRDTPHRVVRSWDELFAGYNVDIPSLFKIFDEGADEMVVLRKIRLMSTCEHHLLNFSGCASVGYLPREGRVLGLSKIARVVNAFSRRLQVQERLTKEIAEAIMKYLNPLGVGVVIRAHHSCMGLRGVMDGGSEMVTSSMLGVFREKPEVKSEFLRLIEV